MDGVVSARDIFSKQRADMIDSKLDKRGVELFKSGRLICKAQCSSMQQKCLGRMEREGECRAIEEEVFMG